MPALPENGGLKGSPLCVCPPCRMEHAVAILEKRSAVEELVQRVLGYLEQLEASAPDKEWLPTLQIQLEAMR